MRHVATALTALLLAGSAQAASFDCTRARSADEHAICNIRALNDRDVKMATLYALDIRLVPMGSRDAIKRDQALWLDSRRACRADTTCLARVYDRRIAVLQAVIDTRVYPRGPF